LAATRLHLDLAIQESSEESVTEVLIRSYKNLSVAMDEIRQLSQSLVAPSLGGIGLDKALAKLIEDMPPTSAVQLRLDTTGYIGDIKDEELKLTCYRIAQIQLSNIIKHSKAKSATIHLRKADQLELSIADDGVGFRPEAKTNGIGLRNIRNRVGYYNGLVTIVSEPGKGCTLTITVPLAPDRMR
ncbi:MAG TPA: ATP-binding protein, partial [Puia sp.]